MKLRLVKNIWQLLAVLAFTHPLSAADPQPNILFIAVDDLNDWIGCMGGHPQAKTPNIDRLANRGTLFLNAHCNAPLCNPSRASVMTGMHPATSGVHGNQQDWRKSPYLQGRPTIGQYFKENGYYTAAAGKIFHANHGCEVGALNGGHGGLRGFNHPQSWTERFPSHDRQIAEPSVMTGRNMNGLDIWHWDWGSIDVPWEETSDGRSVKWAEGQLAKKHDKPFFLAVGIYRPHGPWYVPQEFFDAVPTVEEIKLPTVLKDDVSDIPQAALRYLRKKKHMHQRILDKGLWKEAVRAYLANIAFADTMVGKILDALDQSPYAKNTIVCLWSDHGWHLGEKKRWHKSTNWEEATRVPLIISLPGAQAQKCNRVVSLIDLFPTLIEGAQLKELKGLDGKSLMPLVKDPKAPWNSVAVTTRGGVHHSVRSDHWRYIRYSDGSEELYDHRNDPVEWDNLAMLPQFESIKKQLAESIPQEVRIVKEPSANHREPGFRPIFNGRDLTGWDGDLELWRVEDQQIIGQTVAENPLKHNSFLIWRGGWGGDFELRLEFKISSKNPRANSGIQYRSQERPEFGKWVLSGYQADIDARQKFTGILYEEKGRGILQRRGKSSVKELKSDEELLKAIKIDDWNEYRIVANENRLFHRINGETFMEFVDNDAEKFKRSGLLGLQLHKGPPMEIRFKNLRFKEFRAVEDRPIPEQPYRSRK